MNYDTLSANIFAKPVDEGLMPVDRLETPKRVLCDRFDRSAQNAKIDLHWKDHPWPEPLTVGQNFSAITNSQSQYRDLYRSKYNADINVVLFRNLEEVGPELGHMLVRRRAAVHTFVVSLENLPDRARDREIYEGITCTPLPQENDRFSIDTIAEKAGTSDSKNPEQRGHLSFHSYEKFDPFLIQNLLSLAYMRRRTN